VTLKGPVLLGLATLIFGIGGFVLWGALTPLSSAAIAGGKVIVESTTKTITHLEGGTLLSMHVSEGQKVKAGDLLLKLDSTRSLSTVVQLEQQLFMLRVRMARLIAEKNEQAAFSPVVDVPASLDATAAAELIDTEKKLFQERRSQRAGQGETDQAVIDQLDSQRIAITARRASYVQQAGFVKHDLDSIATLEAKKLATQASLNEKKIMLVDLQSKIAESDAELSENSQRRTQGELALANSRTEYFRALSELLQSTQSDIGRLTQDLVSARDVVTKSDIRAPQDGVIANIRVRSPGSAVVAGQPILDIVPDNQPMLIEGHAKAMDIDTIHIGNEAEITLNSFGSDEAKPLIGHVTYIAADGTVDERTGDVTYVFRAKIDPEAMATQKNLFLYPGMGASVFIVTGERTALTYLAGPFLKSFNRAFRED
jgi:HlyD family secretion protein